MLIPSILAFDTSCLENKNHLIDICNIIQKQIHTTPNSRVIVLNGSYMYAHKPIQQLAIQSLNKSRTYIENEFSKFRRILLVTIQNLFDDEKQQQIILYTLTPHFDNILSLLHGICAVKEISFKTLSSLLKITSHIASILIKNMLHYMYPTLHCAISNIFSLSKTLHNIPICIIPIENIPHTIDHTTVRLAKKYTIKTIAIWNNLKGIRTADPSIIPKAKTVKELDYTTALEISYLGGKFFHPTALYELSKQKSILAIHSLNTKNPITIIHNQATLKKNTCIIITHRKDYIILTLKTTDMFNQHGYLEKIFSVCNQHKVSIETISTSEISVTMTFHHRYLSRSFITTLKKLGEVTYKQHRSIISLIGKDCWSTPKKTAMILQALKHISIESISLGQTGNNISIIIDTQYLQKTLIQLHNTLFE